ncbi:glycosyltransferase family 2 protein [Aestuariivivens sp. NBU2969]|uniref:glycosyltransferase family 2 protein n=1 Tax=Aestuariivivens sp. NBU2969 TaxID=2873267 RepID=UPI001CBFD0C1|nr:glycosyltransferase family 2 protein [Aestuariivivens sp. NBU2969]
MKLSVVSTLYNSKPFLKSFLKEITESIAFLEITDYQLIFVNDGSPDDSLEYLLERKGKLPQIKIIDLSRNFGHHYAMQIGLQEAKGDFIFLIDNDLEVSPSFLIDCFKVMNEDDNIDVVYGFQEKRKGKIIESLGGKLFWWLLSKFSDVEIPKNMLTERLMKSSYLEKFLTLGDSNLFLGGMMHWVGFNQVGIPVKKKGRTGKSTYDTQKRIALMVQAIASFSGKPLVHLFYTGLTITFGSLLASLYLVLKKIYLGESVQLGWTSLVVINVLILGVITTFLGIIGIYIYKIFNQVQNRPNAIIRKIY